MGPLPDNTKWRNKSLQTGIRYKIEKFFDQFHRDIKMIIEI